MFNCKLCKRETPTLRDSHVYPVALHRLLQSGPVPPFDLINEPQHPNAGVNKNLGGIHARFVCHDCEDRQFGPADNEFMRLYHATAEKLPSVADAHSQDIILEGDVALLHRFAIQTLWRGHASGLRFYPEKVLAPVAERFRKMLLVERRDISIDWQVAVIVVDRPGAMIAVPPWRGGNLIKGQMLMMVLPRFSFLVAATTYRLPIPSLAARALKKGPGVNVIHSGRLPDFLCNGIREVAGKNWERAHDFVSRHRAKE